MARQDEQQYYCPVTKNSEKWFLMYGKNSFLCHSQNWTITLQMANASDVRNNKSVSDFVLLVASHLLVFQIMKTNIIENIIFVFYSAWINVIVNHTRKAKHASLGLRSLGVTSTNTKNIILTVSRYHTFSNCLLFLNDWAYDSFKYSFNISAIGDW